jgi:hypothetical protein
VFFVYILLAFFAVIFIIPIKLEVIYNDRKFALAIILFFWKFKLKFKYNIKKQNSESSLQRFKFDKKKLKLFLKLFKCLFSFGLDLIKKIEIKKLLLKVNIGNADASGCAVLYSRMIFVLNSISCFLPRNSEIKILPNFLCEKTEYKFEIIIRIFLYQILTLILKLIFQCTKLIMSVRK